MYVNDLFAIYTGGCSISAPCVPRKPCKSYAHLHVYSSFANTSSSLRRRFNKFLRTYLKVKANVSLYVVGDLYIVGSIFNLDVN